MLMMIKLLQCNSNAYCIGLRRHTVLRAVYFEALGIVAGLSEVNAERLVVVIEEHAEEVLDHQVGLDVPHRPEPRTGHANEDQTSIPHVQTHLKIRCCHSTTPK